MSGRITKDMRSNYQVYVANLRAKGEEPLSFDAWINEYVQSMKEKLKASCELNAIREKQLQDEIHADPFAPFKPGTTIHVQVVFPGEYRIQFEDAHHHYVPGAGSYYPFGVALENCVSVYKDTIQNSIDKPD